MNFRLLVPERVAIDQRVRKITAEAEDGAFCLLRRHIDFVAALVPGLIAFEDERGEETIVAVDHGILVKCGEDVSVATTRMIGGRPLGELERAVREELAQLDARRQRARTAAAKIEVDFIRRLVDLEQRRHA